MKRKKLLKLSILLALLTPTIVNAKEYIICGNAKKFPTIIGKGISIVYVIIKIIVPLLLAISGILSFFKVTFSNNVDESMDKAKKKFITNMLAAIIIFFIASIINFVIGLAAGGKENSFTDCLYCMLHPEECEQQDGNASTLCPGLLSEQYKYNSDCTLKEEYKNSEKTNYANTGETKIPPRSNTIAAIGGGAIARTLINNPNAQQDGEYFKKGIYSKYIYYLYTPKEIDSDKAALVVYLHGRNGSGTNINSLKNDGGGGFFHEVEVNKKEYNAYILVIQVPSVMWLPSGAAMHIIKDTINNNNIDEKRVSLWGYSMGAEAMPDIINSNPHFFASAVFIAKADGNVKVTGFETVPTYGFYRLNDSTGAVTGTPGIINNIKKVGQKKAYIKQYPAPTMQNDGYTEGHMYMPNVVLEDNDIGNGYATIMDWVLDQRRTD